MSFLPWATDEWNSRPPRSKESAEARTAASLSRSVFRLDPSVGAEARRVQSTLRGRETQPKSDKHRLRSQGVRRHLSRLGAHLHVLVEEGEAVGLKGGAELVHEGDGLLEQPPSVTLMAPPPPGRRGRNLGTAGPHTTPP